MSEYGFVTYDGMRVDSDELRHIGVLHKSGRYPWGSGENPFQRSRSFLSYVDNLKAQGLSEAEIAQGIGISTTKLRALKSIAKNEVRAQNEATARRLKEKNFSNVAIGEKMGINESSVRALLDPSKQANRDVLISTANKLREEVDKKSYIDIGEGVASHLGIAQTKMNTAISILEEDGYKVYNNLRVEQMGTGKYTTVKVLAKPGTDFKEVFANRAKVELPSFVSTDGGRTFEEISQKPQSVSSKRLKVRYAEEGGTDADGVIYLRPGVKDLDLGKSLYAQVRIAVDGTHYLKGMAIYRDDLPDGVDMVFNTNKSKTGNKLDALKPMKDDPDSPFGARIKHSRGALNIVNEEGAWEDWSKTLSSQMLSKQSPALAQKQLDLYFQKKSDRLEEINSLTNPVIKKALLEAMADDLDASAVSLKAAAIPRMGSHVILPINSLKENEIYAPNFKNGERVVLIRHPHGGIFEIPELVVNNKNPEGSKVITNRARDAVGINHKVAQQLSGADFDGDTVMVIPNNNRAVKTSKPLAGLADFDPQSAYPGYEGMTKITKANQQTKMGVVSNLVTDMTIKGATDAEIARAVRHSMVIIDAEKHGLNWKQSAKDNNIKQLQKKYQMRPDGNYGGASTIISRASSTEYVNDRRDRRAGEGGRIDPLTGKRMYINTGEKTVTAKSSVTGERIYLDTGKDYRTNPKTGVKEYAVPGTIKEAYKKTKSTKMAETDDAHTLSSGTEIEKIYATHANKMKALANEARLSYLNTPPLKYSPSAKKAYAKEVASLEYKYTEALKNAPRERKAQLLANDLVKQKMYDNPQMTPEDIKKVKSHALKVARERMGAESKQVYIEDKEWEAIQAGAISDSRLALIIAKSDRDRVTDLATPHTKGTMTDARIARAKAMADRGYTRAEIADALDVSTSTLSDVLGES